MNSAHVAVAASVVLSYVLTYYYYGFDTYRRQQLGVSKIFHRIAFVLLMSLVFRTGFVYAALIQAVASLGNSPRVLIGGSLVMAGMAAGVPLIPRPMALRSGLLFVRSNDKKSMSFFRNVAAILTRINQLTLFKVLDELEHLQSCELDAVWSEDGGINRQYVMRALSCRRSGVCRGSGPSSTALGAGGRPEHPGCFMAR